MKVMTILGTRPEIIRLSRTIEKLDHLCQHVLVHTGQNFDPGLSDLFFRELRVRQPDHFLGVRGLTFGEQIGKIIAASERVMLNEKPDKLLILGDTNSALSAIVAKRLGIPVYHMEAGNRCYDDRVPEEVNRRIVDHSSDILLPYTERSRMNSKVVEDASGAVKFPILEPKGGTGKSQIDEHSTARVYCMGKCRQTRLSSKTSPSSRPRCIGRRGA